MSDWSQLDMVIAVPDRVIEEILDEEGAFGPLIVTLVERDHSRFIGVAVERVDGECIRWIETPLQDAAWISVRRGTTSLRELFIDAQVQVVDRRPDLTPVRAWKIDGEILHDDQLPDVGATL